jgi:hypothetical protein
MGKNMIKFKIEDKQYLIPEVMTIGHYVKMYKLKDLFSDDYYAAKLVSLFTGAPVEDLLETDFEKVNYLATEILKLIPTERPKFQDRFELDGVHYGFFPKWEDLSFAEYVDMDTISTKKEDEVLDMLHILAAIMYRPIISERSHHDFDIEKYDVKNMQKRAELFKNKLDVGVILSAQFFFINYANRYSNYFQLSSIKTLPIWTRIKLVWSLRKIIIAALFNRSMVGSLSSIDWLQMILQNTSTSTKKRWWKF